MREPPRLLGAAAVAGVAAAYFGLFVDYGLNLYDEGTLLAQMYRTYQGDRPYLDFHLGYTPGGHYLHAWLFELFGVSVRPLRWALVVCNSLVAGLLFALARRLMTPSFALLPPVLYCAWLPFYPGEFASFNIPYPSWYTTLFFVAGTWLVVRFVETERLVWLGLAGLVTGLGFAFKPNLGLLQMAGAGLALVLVLEPRPGGRGGRGAGLVWWLVALGVLAGLGVMFASQASARDVRIFLLPIIVLLAGLAARRLARRSRGAPSHALLGAGTLYTAVLLLSVLPWALYFLDLLGAARFGRQILFIGTGFEHFYYRPFHVAGPWDAALVAAVAGAIAIGLAVRAGWLSGRLVAGAAALAVPLGAAALARAPMPEGAHAAVVLRAEDLGFTASLLVLWAFLGATLPVLWQRRHGVGARVTLVILAGALAMYLQLYPRTDFMHLINALPLTLVLAAALLARYTAWFAATPHVRRMLHVAVVGGLLALSAYRVSPNVAAVVEWRHGPTWRPQAELGLARAPLGLELGRAPRLRALADTVAYLQANSAPGEPIFTFPAIELLCFLADRPNATRHGYFFPGWPGHAVEAEVVWALERARPRLVVVQHEHQFFFLTAPSYYYVLRAHLEARYRQVAAFGPYRVLARRDVGAAELVTPPDVMHHAASALAARYGRALAGPAPERLGALRALVAERLDFAWPPVVDLLDDPDARVAAAAVDALYAASDPEVAVVLAAAVRAGTVPRERRLAALRRAWASGDVRAAMELMQLVGRVDDAREHDAVLGGLHAIAQKLAIEDDWVGEQQDLPADLVVPKRLRRRFTSPDEDLRLRIFLARVLPRLAGEALRPALHVALGSSSSELRLAAVEGLLHLGDATDGLDLFGMVLPLLVREPALAPAVILELYRRDPAVVGARLATSYVEAFDIEHPALAWILSALGDPALGDLLVTLLATGTQQVRLAAAVGLGRLADPATAPALRRAAAEDPDHEVRDFARRALEALPAP